MEESVRSVSPADMLCANEALLYDGASIRPLLPHGSSERHSDMIELDGLPFLEESSSRPLLAEGIRHGDTDVSRANGFQRDCDDPASNVSLSLSIRRLSTVFRNNLVETHNSTSSDDKQDERPTAAVSNKGDFSEARFATRKLLAPWFPESDPQNERAQTFRTWHSRRDVVLLTCSLTGVMIFLINFLSTAILNAKRGSQHDLNDIFKGDCSRTAQISTGLHVVINLLSTLLLGASNMCMQLLAAPTRSEINRAHKNFSWLDIGVPSLRNLRYIGRERLVVWLLLGLSSVPIHFLYNSAIFSTQASNSYDWLVVTPQYLEGDAWNLTETNATLQERGSIQMLGLVNDAGSPVLQPLSLSINKVGWISWPTSDRVASLQAAAQNGTSFTRLSKLNCFKQYSSPFGDRSDLIMVASDVSNNSVLACGMQGDAGTAPEEWMCQQSNTFSCKKLASGNYGDEKDAELAINHWNIFGYEIEYCMASYRQTKSLCSVVYSYRIMIVVCCFNYCKCICIIYTAIRYSRHSDPPLSILGDALASFLKEPDPYTKGMGIVSKADITTNVDSWNRPLPKVWKPSKLRWASSASQRRWYSTLTVCVLLLATASVFFVLGLRTLQHELARTDWKSLTSLGVGNLSFHTLVNFLPRASGASALYSNILFANLAQFLVSFIYLAFNALLTCFLVSNEWAGYQFTRKRLRVSFPEGIQRSTYFISMPLKYGIPLTLSMMLLHWSVSQSVFVVRVVSHFSDGTMDEGSTLTVTGYSAMGIIISFIVFGTMVLALLLIGLRRYPVGMPLASTCSAAISAACHQPLPDDEEAYLFPVQWGEVNSNTERVGFGHCCFTTAKDVEGPTRGRLYA